MFQDMVFYLLGMFNGTMFGVVCYRNFYSRLYHASKPAAREMLERNLVRPVSAKTAGEALFTVFGSCFSDSFMREIAERMEKIAKKK